MSRKRPSVHKRHNPPLKEAKTIKPSARLLEWILGICTLLGGLAAVITFLPRITITPNDPVDAHNAFSVSFTIMNASFVPIPLQHVSIRFFPGQIMTKPLPFNPPKKFIYGSGGFQRPEWADRILQGDERYTVTLDGMFAIGGNAPYVPAELSGADVAMIVRYKPWFIPFERERAFRFATHRQSNGAIYWYSTPLD
jgi:hypothetical protein